MQIVFFYTTKKFIIRAVAQKFKKSGSGFPEPAICANEQPIYKPWKYYNQCPQALSLQNHN
jgi:hypothetical protein